MAATGSSTYFRLKINDTDLPSSLNIFNKAILQCGYGLSVPVAMFTFDDSNNILIGNLAIVDGTRLTVEIGSSEDDTVEYNFVCISTDEDPLMSSSVITVYCILDCPALTTESAMDVFENVTSIDAMSQLAGTVGLEYDAPDVTTDDAMTWINSGKSRSQFFKDLTEYSYISDKDALTTVIDFDAVRTRSSIGVLKADPEHNFYYQATNYSDSKAVLIDEIEPESRSGILNISNGYGHFHYQASASGTDLEYTSIQPSVQGEGLNINADIKAAISRSKLTAGRYFDCGGADLNSGNVHKEYYKAPYVHTRIMSLFSNCIRVVTREFNNLNLLTPIEIFASSSKDEFSDSSRYSGNYMLGGKTIYLEPGYYMEAYDCYRSFLTATGNTNAVAGATSDSDSGFAPEVDSDELNPVVVSGTAGTGNKIQNTSSDANKNNGLTSQLNTKFGLDSDVADSVSSGNLPNVKAKNTDSSGTTADDNVRFGLDVGTPPIVAETVTKMNAMVKKLDDKFIEESAALSFPELESKWGKASDKLLALGTEFQAAKAKLDYCKSLNNIQLLAVKSMALVAPSVLSMLVDRMTSLNSALTTMDNMLRDAGILDMTDPSDPSASIECGAAAQTALKNASKGVFDDVCVDDKAAKVAQLPKLKIMDKLRKLERMYEDLICAATNDVAEDVAGDS